MLGRPACMLVVLGLLGPVAGASAATRTWDGDAGDGLWHTPANWSDDAKPVAGDVALLSSGAQVTIAGAPAAAARVGGPVNTSTRLVVDGVKLTLGGPD